MSDDPHDYAGFCAMSEGNRRRQYDRLNDALRELSDAYAEHDKLGRGRYPGCIAGAVRELGERLSK